jgi:integrase/recombinase XerD
MSQPSKIEQQILMGEDYILVWIDAFLKERLAQNLTKGTVKYYKENLLPFAKYLETQEIKYISQITANNIRDFLLLLEEKGHNSGGVHGYFRAIKAFLRWYENEVEPEGWKNPIHKIKAPKNPVEPIEGISREDFDSLLEACPRDKFFGERDRTILLLLMDTGVRASELCQINLDDINFPDSSILIRQGKERKPRFVFYGKKTRRQLRKWLTLRGREGHSLFTNRYGERISYGTLREIMRRLSLKAGIKEPGLHDFRRAFCLECLRSGMSEITIARLMGHTTTQLIGRYAKQTAVDLMNSYRSPLDD